MGDDTEDLCFVDEREAEMVAFSGSSEPYNRNGANSSWEAAWDSYDIAAKKLKFFAPPRLYESDVTVRYSIWWKNHRVTCCNVVKAVAGPCMPLKNAKKTEKEMVSEKPDENGEFMSNVEKKDMQNEDDDVLVFNESGKVYKRRSISCVKPLETAAQGGTHKRLKLSMKGWEKIKQNANASRKCKAERKRRYLKDFTFDFTGKVHRETMDDFDGKEFDDFATSPMGFRPKERGEVVRLISEDSQLEMQIKALKKEIAGFQAKMMNLESLQEEESKSEVSSSDE
ncbi:hypothetical protein KSP39_PZI022979 [Platanthera zijinensis]|uniref:Uncharacterized protein n=1 Tax=Platanthera zijinensis TaxID=2320716 RepID=A0AAP0AWK9_9ASPA